MKGLKCWHLLFIFNQRSPFLWGLELLVCVKDRNFYLFCNYFFLHFKDSIDFTSSSCNFKNYWNFIFFPFLCLFTCFNILVIFYYVVPSWFKDRISWFCKMSHEHIYKFCLAIYNTCIKLTHREILKNLYVMGKYIREVQVKRHVLLKPGLKIILLHVYTIKKNRYMYIVS